MIYGLATIPKEDLKLKYDGLVAISTGWGRKAKKWKEKKILWSEFLARQSNPVRTSETAAIYRTLSREETCNITDVGGYVGGTVQDGVRNEGSVLSRSLLTLDMDYAPTKYAEIIEILFDHAICYYSTHSHTPTSPRLRLIIPLTRAVGPEEYEALGRKIADEIGSEYFDDST